MLRSLGLTFVLFVLVLAFVVTNTGCAGVTAASKASTVTASAAISVSVTPSTVSIQTGGTQQFTATVTGLANTAVTWSATGGTVSITGLYTAPTAAGTYTVTATSASDSSESATATVTVTTTPVPIGISITPLLASLTAGGTQQFTATVTGTTNTSVTWSASGGTVSSTGLYTAPSSPGTYSVTATSAADPSKSASSAVTVSAGVPAIAVSVNPTSPSIQAGSTQQFSATVTGTTNTAVTWSASAGTISSGGLYRAPASAGTYSIIATSVADTTKSGIATVTVTAAPPVVSVAINPNSSSIQTGATQQFTATVNGSTNTAVTWSATGGTVSSFRSLHCAGNRRELHGEGNECRGHHEVRFGDCNR